MGNPESDLLKALPLRVRRKVEELSRQLGRKPQWVIEKAVNAYSRMHTLTSEDLSPDQLEKLLADPEWKRIYSKFMQALAKRRSASLSKERRKEIADHALKIRHEKLSPDERSRLARKAVQRRWEEWRRKKSEDSTH